jgi:predicted GIY-YIG superfamily endonuclease
MKNLNCRPCMAYDGTSEPFDFENYSATNPQHGSVYLNLLNCHNGVNYLKVGTAEDFERRMMAEDYKKYRSVRVLAVLEVENHDAMYQLEDAIKMELRQMPGTTFKKNDRFYFNRLPEEIAVKDAHGVMGVLKLCKCVDNPHKKCYTYSVERS